MERQTVLEVESDEGHTKSQNCLHKNGKNGKFCQCTDLKILGLGLSSAVACLPCTHSAKFGFKLQHYKKSTKICLNLKLNKRLITNPGGSNGTSGHSCLTPVCLFLPASPSYRCTWRWLGSHLSQWGAQAFECLFVSPILLKPGTPLPLQPWIQLIGWSILSPKRNLTHGNDLGH